MNAHKIRNVLAAVWDTPQTIAKQKINKRNTHNISANDGIATLANDD